MRKIFLTLHTGYCGMDAHEAWLVPEDVPNDELDDWAYWKAVDHAETYGIYPPAQYEYDDEVDEYEEVAYSGENIDGHWRLYKEEDDGYLLCGYQTEVQWNEYR